MVDFRDFSICSPSDEGNGNAGWVDEGLTEVMTLGLGSGGGWGQVVPYSTL